MNADPAETLLDIDALRQRADLALAREAYRDAERIYRQILDVIRARLGTTQPSYLECLNGLALATRAAGDLETSRNFYSEAVEISRVLVGENHPLHTSALLNFATVCWSIGDNSRAELQFQRVVDLSSVDPYEYLRALQHLTRFYAATGRAREAWGLLQAAENLQDGLIWQAFSRGAERDRFRYLQSVRQNCSLFLSLVSEKLAESTEAVQSALDLVLRRKGLVAEVACAQRNAVLRGGDANLKRQMDRLVTTRQQIARKTLSGPSPGETRTAHEATLSNWRAEQRELEKDLARSIPDCQLEFLFDRARVDSVAARLPPDTALLEYVKFQRYDLTRYPSPEDSGWREERYAVFVLTDHAPDSVRMFDLGEARVIDQMIADYRSAVSHARGAAHRGLIAEDESDSETFEDIGCALHAAVFARLNQALADRKRLLIAPDGELNCIPFETFPLRAAKDFLIDRYSISYLDSGRDLVGRKTTTSGEAGVSLVVADPAFDYPLTAPSPRQGRLRRIFSWGNQKFPAANVLESSASTPDPGFSPGNTKQRRFEALPGARWEGRLVSETLGAEFWQGTDALEGRLKRIVSPAILHIATHGFFSGRELSGLSRREPSGRGDGWVENPLLLSGLALAGANRVPDREAAPTDVEDGILTAEEITGLNLLDTDLVVLSACETGVGKIMTGEGVFGLRRAFGLAGARSIIISLWKAADLPTAILMVKFYALLIHERLPKNDALREARRFLRELTVGELAKWPCEHAGGAPEVHGQFARFALGDADEKPFAHPFFWGPFVLVGDPALGGLAPSGKETPREF